MLRRASWLAISPIFPLEQHTEGVYRLAHRLYVRAWAGPALLVVELWRTVTGISIGPGAQIGRGFTVYHGQGVRIGGACVIGERCSIHQQVTIGGASGASDRDGQPVIGDDVFIGAGAKIIGPVHIGDGATIGANSVVTRDVAAHTVVVGAPAHPIRTGD
ncbi:MAG: serine acetyltransferase [Actinobacteria bacterium]|nr:serine acetyltransferase [Actinomycetota bacterium]